MALNYEAGHRRKALVCLESESIRDEGPKTEGMTKTGATPQQKGRSRRMPSAYLLSSCTRGRTASTSRSLWHLLPLLDRSGTHVRFGFALQAPHTPRPKFVNTTCWNQKSRHYGSTKIVTASWASPCRRIAAKPPKKHSDQNESIKH